MTSSAGRICYFLNSPIPFKKKRIIKEIYTISPVSQLKSAQVAQYAQFKGNEYGILIETS